MNPHCVYIICGATASGKTAVSISLAKHLSTGIISADSRQCYKEISIGTAKPTLEQLREIPHYFIDEFPIANELNAADFEKLAIQYLDNIFQKSDTAIVCGGTGLYIKALCEGLDDMPETNKKIAEEIESAYNNQAMEWLQQQIKKEDIEFYNTGEIQNPARLIRALSFVRSTGKSILSYRTNNKKQRPFSIIKIGLELPREVLYARINQRVDDMMKDGLLDEVKRLYPFRNLKNLQTVGYSELFDYLGSKYSLEQAIEKIKQNTRHYAKRQMTWFRKDNEINWFSANDKDIIDKILTINKSDSKS